MERFRTYFFAIVLLAAALTVAACTQSAAPENSRGDESAVQQDQIASQGGSAANGQTGTQASSQSGGQATGQGQGAAVGAPGGDAPERRNPIVTIQMESGGEIKIELYPDIAPNTVNNFLYLARSGFYDGTIFHRVVPGFVIQGGDPTGTGGGGPGYSIRGEFTVNGFRNDLKHERGVVSMARTQDPNSAGSQFFITVAAAPHLDGQYAAFGRVIQGMDVVDRIVSVPRTVQDRPVQPQRIAKVTVEQFGVEYPEPERI